MCHYVPPPPGWPPDAVSHASLLAMVAGNLSARSFCDHTSGRPVTGEGLRGPWQASPVRPAPRRAAIGRQL